MKSKPTPGRKEIREAWKTTFPSLVYVTRVHFGQKVSGHCQAIPQNDQWMNRKSRALSSTVSPQSEEGIPGMFSLSATSEVWFHQLWKAEEQRTTLLGAQRGDLRAALALVNSSHFSTTNTALTQGSTAEKGQTSVNTGLHRLVPVFRLSSVCCSSDLPMTPDRGQWSPQHSSSSQCASDPGPFDKYNSQVTALSSLRYRCLADISTCGSKCFILEHSWGLVMRGPPIFFLKVCQELKVILRRELGSYKASWGHAVFDVMLFFPHTVLERSTCVSSWAPDVSC
ncbi:hypothetical protein H920_11428 [Fukomys damarensis]|uniref:Uncharacterized protein n=1 Tax=Fukomys damarensis TaxID=885580 RepID=A0A091D9M3_FUKDA|nr:hypothetical protein H920_11428 [Fukomys damarensis]